MTTEHNPFPHALSLAVHELRTPVTVVAGYLRMLLREQGGPLVEKQRKMLEEAERSCGRIGALVAEISELSKLESGELTLARQPFDLAALVVELASGMHDGHDRGVRLEVHVDRALEVVGDRPRIAAAVGALMQAALRERGEPGAIVVECSALRHTDPPSALVAIGDPATVRSFRDTRGDGAPFDEWRGGLGLALPVARRVVDAHGGALWSAPGDRPRAGSALRLPMTTTYGQR